MKSVAIGHFPRVVVQANRFWLYNPILKKRYENRPEERVRLKWVEYILHQTEWKRSRIGFESPVKTQQDKNMLRADLVLYSDQMKPTVLVECKSEQVKITTKTAEQAAKYNSQVNAPYLVLTNGIEDFWYEQKDGKIHQTENIFEEHTSLTNLDRNFEYWHRRGFSSKNADVELKNWLASALNLFWSDPFRQQHRYLDFRETILPVPMNHYYKLFEIGSEQILAVSFIGTPDSDSWLVAIQNSAGENKGVLSINLAELHKEEKEAATLFMNGEKKKVSVKDKLLFRLSDFAPDHIENLSGYLMNFFD